MNVFLVVLLVLAGVALLLMEMFLLPGFGIAGVSGFGCLLAAIVVAYIWIGRMAGYITLAAGAGYPGIPAQQRLGQDGAGYPNRQPCRDGA